MKIIVLLGALTILLSAPALSQEAGEADLTPREEIHPKPKEYFVDVLLPHLWEGTKASFSAETVPYWALTGIAAGLAFTQDQGFREYFEDHDPIGDWKVIGNSWGEGYTQAGIALGFWGGGWLAGDQKLAATGEVLMESEIINGLVTTAMKQIVGRERPDQSGNDSFPSGHTSDSFCFAAVIDHRLGHGWGIPAYGLALFTGLSRMESDKHWLSDVAMGAGLGTIIGYSVSKNHDDWPYQKRWHLTDKKMPGNAVLIPILPENKKGGAGIGIYIPLE